MKKNPIQLLWLLLLSGFLACAHTASAQSQFYWDATSPIHNSPGSGGTGNWSTTVADWWVEGAADSVWTNGSYANFEGTPGTVTVSAAVTANGINFATNGYSIGGSSTLTLAGTPTITLPNSGSNTMSCPISGTAPVTISGSSMLIWTHGNSTFSGGATISPGTTLVRTTAAAAGTGAITNNGILDDTVTGANAFSALIFGGSTSVINTFLGYNIGSENIRYINSALANFNGTLNIIAGLNSTNGLPGAGQIIMTNIVSSSMTWNVGSGATLLIQPPGSPFTANLIILNGPGNSQPFGALRLDAVTLQANVLLNGTNITIGDDNSSAPSQITGVISDNGQHLGYTRVVSGKTIILSGANTYTGPTILSAGIQQLASPEIPGTSGPLGASLATNPGSIVMSGGTIQYSSANSNDYSGRFSTATGAAYNIDENGQSVTFATRLASSGGSLTLTDTAGGGTLTLSAANTYNGITTVNSGTLNISGSIAGTVVNVNGGTLELSKATALPQGTILTLPSSPSGGMVNLNFSGTQNITTLNFGTTPMAPGTYGASDNTNVLYPNAAFAGTGILNVQPPTYWDANGSDALNQTNLYGGGSGNWDNATSNWWQNGSSDVLWTANNIATFAGTAGTVTLDANVTADGLTFNTSSYVITNSGNVVLTLGGTPIINFPNGGAAEIDCRVGGTAGLTQNGAGMLTLGGNNTYLGPTVISAGNALTLNGSNAYTGPTTIGTSSSLTIGNSGNLAGGNYPGAIDDEGTLTYNSSAAQVLSGIISGAGSVNQNGPGMLTLSGLNTFSGGISIANGALAISGLADLGNNPTFNTGNYSGSITDNGALILDSSTTQTLSGGVNGSGSLTQNGSGALTLSGGNNYSGITTIGSNSVLIVTGSLNNGDYETNLINDGTFTFNNSSVQTLAGPVSGSGVLTVTGFGTLTLTATNSYTGGTSIGSGSDLTIGDPGVLDNGVYAASITNLGTLSYSSSAAQTLSGPISGSGGSVVQNGPGTLTLTGTNTFTGVLNIAQGTALVISGSGNLGNGNYAGGITDSGALVYNTTARQTLSGTIFDNGVGGTLAQTGSGLLILTGNESYIGTTTIGTGSVLVIGGAGLLNGGDYETNIIDNGAFAFDSSSAQIVGGVISGSGGLAQIGSGTLTLTGTNTYTGATVVSNGVLALSGSGSINGSTSVSISAGATFDVSAIASPYNFSSASFSATGNATNAAAINGPSGGTINLGSQPISLTFAPQSFNGDATHPALNIPEGALTLNGNRVTVNNAGASPLGAGTYSLIQVAGGTLNGTASLGSVTGAGLAANSTASLSVSSGSLNLVVAAGAPAPAINSVTVSNGKLVFSGINGPDNGTYVVLSSTNVLAPISQWTPVKTNNFSGTGTFSSTNNIGSTGNDFFIIKVTSP